MLERIWGGLSLRKACVELGLHAPSTSEWLHADKGREEQYARAREGRAEHFQEQVLELGHAAATGREVEIDGQKVKIDPAGLRVYQEGIKWAAARMAPKTAPVQRIDLTARTRQMTDEEIAAELAAMEAGETGA